jgi:glycosyltransferase involved in cell wall biosynthesis
LISPRVVILRSNPLSPDPRSLRAATALKQAGLQVTLIGWERSGRNTIAQQRPYGSVVLMPIAAGFGRGLRNLPHLLRWQASLLRWLRANRRDYQAIHACDFDTVLPALLAGRLGHKPVVYDIFDFYADMLRGMPRFIRQAIRLVDLWAIGRADAVILPDPVRMAQLQGARPRRMIVIYNSPIDVSIPPAPKMNPVSFRLSVVGMLNLERGLLELIQVLGHHPEWELALAGYGTDETAIRSAAACPNVTMLGRIDYQNAMSLNGAADALVATYDPAIPHHRYASPNKAFEAMMLGKPLVVAQGTHIDELVSEIGCGLVVPYGDVEALDIALTRLAKDPDLRRRMGQAGRKAYEQRFNWAEMETRLADLYYELGIAADLPP